MALNPFRQQIEPTRYAGDAATIYEDIGDMPPKNYGMELRSYAETRYRRGLLVNTVPMACYSGVVGAFYGYWISRRHMRHIPMLNLVGRNAFAFAVLGWATAGIHHGLIYMCDYKAMAWQTSLSGTVGGAAFAFMSHGNIPATIQAGMIVGCCYTLLYAGGEMWRERNIRDFFYVAQSGNTPIGKVTPELQAAYRAYLFDNRPMEEDDVEMRRFKLKKRKENDSRLDAKTHIDALQNSVWGISFPEWWPLKLGEAHPENVEALARTRSKEDEIARRKKHIMDSGDTSYFAQGFTTRAGTVESLAQDFGKEGPSSQPRNK